MYYLYSVASFFLFIASMKTDSCTHKMSIVLVVLFGWCLGLPPSPFLEVARLVSSKGSDHKSCSVWLTGAVCQVCSGETEAGAEMECPVSIKTLWVTVFTSVCDLNGKEH